MKNKITIVSTFKEGYAIARKEINQKFLYGYVNEELNEVIPFIYDMAFPFMNGRAYVKKMMIFSLLINMVMLQKMKDQKD